VNACRYLQFLTLIEISCSSFFVSGLDLVDLVCCVHCLRWWKINKEGFKWLVLMDTPRGEISDRLDIVIFLLILTNYLLTIYN